MSLGASIGFGHASAVAANQNAQSPALANSATPSPALVAPSLTPSPSSTLTFSAILPSLANQPYQDNVIEGLAPLVDSADSVADINSAGWPRGVTLQLSRNLQTSDRGLGARAKSRTDTRGLQLDAFIDTPNYGAISINLLALGGRVEGLSQIQADSPTTRSQGLTSWTIRQIGMPFDDGWRLDNAIGSTNLLLPEIARRSARLLIPAPQILGGSMVARQVQGQAFSAGAAAGEPGRFEGFPQSRFVGTGGQAGSVFVDTKINSWTLGATAVAGRNVLAEDLGSLVSSNDIARINTEALYVSALKESSDANNRWQVSAIASNQTPASSTPATLGTSATSAPASANTNAINSYGLWADATWRDGAARQQASLFRFTRGLRWLDRPLISDLQGAGYRFDYNRPQWDLATNIELFESVGGVDGNQTAANNGNTVNTGAGWFSSANARWRINSRFSTGVGGAIRQLGNTSRSGFGYVQWLNWAGDSRLQFDANASSANRNAAGPSGQALTIEHALPSTNQLALSVSLSVERLKNGANLANPAFAETSQALQRDVERAISFGLNGRAEIYSALYLQASIRARHSSQVNRRESNFNSALLNSSTASGVAITASIGLDWQLNRNWTLGASYYENRGAIIDALAIQSPVSSPLTPLETLRIRPTDRGIFINLRYTARAGSMSVPLGGPPGSGAGRLEGSVYLDSNSNGSRDANENGAANILVLLDGKFSTRTNNLGGFEFISVASGAHTLSVLQDDLPLPWSFEGEPRFDVSVSTRTTSRIDMGAKRMR